MRTVPVMLTWELLTRGRWALLLGLVGANVLPWLLYAAFRQYGEIDADDTAFLVMHVVLVQIMMFAFGSAVYQGQGHIARLFALPITNASLVTWHMLPAVVLMLLQVLVSTALLNALYDLHWPLWGPACVAAVGMALMQAVTWTSDNTAWVAWLLAAVAAMVGLWFKAQYGPVFGFPTHWWEDVTPVDVLTLLAALAAAFALGVQGVALRRRGEALPALGFWSWIERLLERPSRTDRPFDTPAAAQFWFDWTSKGWAMPALVAFGMSGGTAAWAIFSANLNDLLEGYLVGGGSLSVAGLLAGIVLGNFGIDDSRPEMGHFLATRPMSTTGLTKSVLTAAGLSVLGGWLIWATGMLLLGLAFRLTGVTARGDIWDKLHWWYWPATLLGPWLTATVFAALGMTGRPRLTLQLLFGSFAALLTGSLLSQWVLTPASQQLLATATMACTGVALLGGSAWALRRAWQRGLTTTAVATSACAVWAMLSGVVVLGGSRGMSASLPVTVLILGLLALLVAPVATAPLALEWNRRR